MGLQSFDPLNPPHSSGSLLGLGVDKTQELLNYLRENFERLEDILSGDIFTFLGDISMSLIDDIQFLLNPPACRLSHNATQTLTNGAFTTIAFNSEYYDTDTMHDTVTNNSRITIKTAGIYVVQSCLSVPGDADGERITEFLVNGTIEAAFDRRGANATTGGDILPLTVVRKFAVNDFVVCRFYHTAGANLTMDATTATGEIPSFSATWIGKG